MNQSKPVSSTSTNSVKNQATSTGSRRLKILLIPLALTISLGTGMGLYVWDLYKAFQRMQTQDMAILNLSNQITYLDEVLTSSARLASTTAEKRWEERYLSFVPKLDTALAQAENLLPNLFQSQGFATTNAANDRLIEMEDQAFKLIEQGNVQAAKALLLSPEYEKQKEIYAQGLEEVTTGLQNYVTANLTARSQQTFSAIGMIGIVLGILVVTWIVIFRMMREYIRTIHDTAIVLSSTSTEIASTIEQQERTISQQATSVNETTTTMDELGASTRQAAEQAEASSQGTQQALTLAEDGSQVVQQTVQSMSTLKEQVRAIAEQIMHLSEQTGQIAGISELVGDIANQTNMLALNAAVEAARAGEQGKGFGVVAGEIRKLADETKKSAQKINILVAEIQAAMNSTVMVTDEGTKKTNESIELAQGTAATFISVADAINSVFLNSQQISLSSKQQAIGVQQVVAAMNALNLGARETAAGINQVKISTEHLNQAAQKLRALV